MTMHISSSLVIPFHVWWLDRADIIRPCCNTRKQGTGVCRHIVSRKACAAVSEVFFFFSLLMWPDKKSCLLSLHVCMPVCAWVGLLTITCRKPRLWLCLFIFKTVWLTWFLQERCQGKSLEWRRYLWGPGQSPLVGVFLVLKSLSEHVFPCLRWQKS